jgi:hypothetical protein
MKTIPQDFFAKKISAIFFHPDFDVNEAKQDKLSVKVLSGLIRKMSPVEIKWLTRIIMKDTKCG